jgi:FtsP/CotA-like multicopper oxidase with cupredoxin domain
MTSTGRLRSAAAVDRPLTPFVDPLPIPARYRVSEGERLVVGLQTGEHRFHSDLPPSPVWTYDGHVPGPMIDVDRGVRLEVVWDNRLEGVLPVTVVRAPMFAGEDGVPVQCVAGRGGAEPIRAAEVLPGYAVVHLHGGLTSAPSDGWAENLVAPGRQALDLYENDQRAALLWFHDHVMGVTRFNVYAGLAGLYVIRDDRERTLGLAEGPPHEVPLLLADRNFDTDTDGRITGRLLHKTDPEVMEAFAPFTIVNGAVWPYLEVEPTTYRFRILNGSNARTYRLVLTREGRPDHGRVTQIGTDGGLLPGPVGLPRQGLVLASAERADLLVDFSDLAPGDEITVWNTAPAPFDGAWADPADGPSASLDGLLPYPEVLQIRVVGGPRHRRPIPARLTGDYPRIDRSALRTAPRRAVALVELEAGDPDEPPMLTLRELVEDPDGDGPVVTVIEPDDGRERTTRWRTVATRFDDGVTFLPMLGHAEVWRFINLTEDTHPMHVHLDALELLERHPATVEVDDGQTNARDTSATVRVGEAPDDDIPHAIDDNERGFKDTVRVNANEVVDVAVRFDAYAGRYMYHCHILEHEDHDMMRPFVVTPHELMPFMEMKR